MKLINLKNTLKVLDIPINFFLFAAFNTSYWAGTWELLPTYIFPNNTEVHLWTCFALGSLIIMVFRLLQHTFSRYVKRKSTHPVIYVIITRLYTYIGSWGYISFWRGVWETYDFYDGKGTRSAWISLAVAYIPLVLLRSARNVIATPLGVSLDNRDLYFLIPSRFSAKKDCWWKFTFDQFFSHFICLVLTAIMWRAVWRVSDSLLFPGQRTQSAVTSLIIGYSMNVIVVILQIPAFYISRKLSKNPNKFFKIAFEDLYLFFVSMATIQSWRGCWDLTNIFIVERYPLYVKWLLHFAGFFTAVIIQTTHTLFGVAIFVDGSFPGGTGVVLPMQYLTVWFRDKIVNQTHLAPHEPPHEVTLSSGQSNQGFRPDEHNHDEKINQQDNRLDDNKNILDHSGQNICDVTEL